MATTRTRPPINAAAARATARSIGEEVAGRDFLSQKWEFYETTMKRARKLRYAVPKGTSERLREIMLSPDFGRDNKLKNEWWREMNTLCVDINPYMSPAEKKAFKMRLAAANGPREMAAVDESWMLWYIHRMGTPNIGDPNWEDFNFFARVPGHGYFEFFAEKLLEDDRDYLREEWYWEYMFHMVNETARLAVEGSGMPPSFAP